METQDNVGCTVGAEIEKQWQGLARDLNLLNPQIGATINPHALYYWCTEHAIRHISKIAAEELFRDADEGDAEENRQRFMERLASLKAEVATKLALVSLARTSRQMRRIKRKKKK